MCKVCPNFINQFVPLCAECVPITFSTLLLFGKGVPNTLKFVPVCAEGVPIH